MGYCERLPSRFEYKYVLGLEQAARFRESISEHMHLDEHVGENEGYWISSVYFDSCDYKSYFDKIDGEANRYKIRLRYYRESSSLECLPKTFFFEVKYRAGDLISKDRFRLTEQAASESLRTSRVSGQWNNQGELILDRLLQGLGARPVVNVSYFRKSYVCPRGTGLRITFDSCLSAAMPDSSIGIPNVPQMSFLPEQYVILEIKFNWSMPRWVCHLAQAQNLKLRRYSKYCSALEKLYPEIGVRKSL
jgi:SPX domain protein involved in polyphosphate accumulation